ncbi:hypothetical protein E5F05_11570 [Deinococcus metallilatus]|uniref:Uncharacterized protein n=1 Tax=Deinococcus metallilatus TaxID=1211322 RepID=A0AAJ5F3Z0_9DEIO|nr:hypothetical protein [Deinococcus metallilatus]MBB5295327.1 hypothetical protein [Deinococcus metallilatus]QBY08519.1 hypothetical protein E5F05_11570 [Deinococcus metallilatus]RXJ11029.1 hypothetical protein ERJ73_10390 [Deinococcus metallilatus]TLK21593.1 hypothetical protein FCS05_18920 [Deinococcus metallilatus]GMA15102.1 hypothetical protein GCM10025871_14330 [Deinococcus metallilatus]
MKKLLTLATIMLPSALAAPVTTVPADLFHPTPAKVEDLCKKAQTTAADTSLNALTRRVQQVNDGGTADIIFDGGVGGVNVQLQGVGVSAYNICAGRTTRLEAMPSTADLLAASPVLVYINGSVPELANVRTWRAVLVLLGPDGKELARLTPSSASLGEPNYWKASCSGGRCVWRGGNVYRFTPASPFDTVLPAGSKLRVLATFGQGVQQLDLGVK